MRYIYFKLTSCRHLYKLFTATCSKGKCSCVIETFSIQITLILMQNIIEYMAALLGEPIEGREGPKWDIFMINDLKQIFFASHFQCTFYCSNPIGILDKNRHQCCHPYYNCVSSITICSYLLR